jgi:hypothetical protein
MRKFLCRDNIFFFLEKQTATSQTREHNFVSHSKSLILLELSWRRPLGLLVIFGSHSKIEYEYIVL